MKTIALVLMLALACRNIPVDPVIIEPTDTDRCHAACVRLRQLSCPESETLADGTTCEVFCVATQREGHALRPSCVQNIQRCADVRQCQ